MKNKILKSLLILGILFVLFVGAVLTFIVYSLPSAHKISEAISGSKKPTTEVKPTATTSVQAQNQTVQSTAISEDVTQATNPKNPEANQTRKSDFEDLINPDVPLSNFCRSLRNPNAKILNTAEFDAEFKKSEKNAANLAGNTNANTNTNTNTNSDEQINSDPRIESMKPLFRTIFREPTMKELLMEAKSAVDNKDENFWQKAAFYSKAVVAFQAMLANKSELEAVSDRSYLFIKMNELMAKHPELKDDQRIMKFCSDTEDAFNTMKPVQFDEEKKNFERLLQEVGVKPVDIKYDANYKTKYEFSFTGRSMQMSGGWLETAFAKEKPETKAVK